MSCESFFKSLTRKKPMEVSETKLVRFLTTFDLTAIGVGSTLGLCVYVLSGQVSKNIAGPAVIISFGLAAVAAVLAGLCFAEFGARVPKAGSAYIYTFITVGEFVAFLIGWNLILEYAIGSAAIAKGITSYIDALVGNQISDFWLRIMPMDIPYLGRYVDLFAFGIVIAVSIGLAFGAKESAMMNNVFATIKVVVILYVIICGCFKLDFTNWAIPINKVPEGGGQGGFFPFGFVGVVKGAAICFFGFIGFDIIASAGEEVKNPKKSIPLSICLSLLIITMAYIGVSSVLTLMVPYFELDAKAPLPHVFGSFGWTFAVYVVSIGSIFGLFSCLIGAIFPLPRIMFAMAEDGLLFGVFAKVHHKFKTPTWGILIAGFLTATLSAVFDVDQLVNMISIGTLTAYTIVAVCVLLLKYEVDDENLIDDRHGFPSKILNSAKLEVPTKFTSRLVTVIVWLYILLNILMSLCISLFGDKILEGEVSAIILLGLPIILIFVALIVLARQPKSSKVLSFSVPFTPWFPALSIMFNIYLLAQLGGVAWIRFGAWMAIGFLIYIFYGRRYSKMKERALVDEFIQNAFDEVDD